MSLDFKIALHQLLRPPLHFDLPDCPADGRQISLSTFIRFVVIRQHQNSIPVILPPFVSSPAPYTATQQFPILNIDTRRNDQDRPKTRHTDPSFIGLAYEESIEREKAYPDGPRLIIEPNIWLYAEPDLELAKTYDVVVNVAREVGNPFIVTESLDLSRISPQSEFDETSTSPFSPVSSSTNPSPSLPSSISSGSSPKLPLKATESGLTSYKFNDVEYMHIPWDHNSSLSEDLPGIVDHILERSEEGKKVLVHCQVFAPP